MRRPSGWLAAGAALVAGLALAVGVVTSAQAATLLSDDFNDGNADGWSKSGGSWSVVTDSSAAYRQSSVSSDARATTGTASWTNVAVQARVKPTAFSSTDRFVAVAARVVNNTNYYYLALRGNNTVELRKLVGGSSSTLASASFTVAVNTWYTVRLEAAASTLTGSVNGTVLVSATDGQFSAGKVGLATNYASATFDDVAVETVGPVVEPSVTTPPTSPPATVTPTPTIGPTLPVPDGLVGYAALSGDGRGPTTGGAGGATVTVTTAAELTDAVDQRVPLVVQVSGIIPISGQIYVRSDKTVVGLGANSGVTGGGFKVSNNHNVIFRNLRISFATGTDAIGVQSADHIWIDHNDLSSDRAHDIDYYDGLIDITHATDFVTVSWNVIHDHWKTSLVGHDDDNAAEDTGHLSVTYHHNYWYNLDARGPSIRFGTAHVYDNYYVNDVNAIHSRMGAQVLAENNVFRSVTTPIKTTTLSVQDGFVVERGNDFGTGVNTITQIGTFTTAPYPYPLDATAQVPAIVLANAGTGHL